jgi:hypothetical protein
LSPAKAWWCSTHNNYSKGNVAYADVLKVGHENYRTDLLDLMQREKVPAEEQRARLPNQTFRDRMTLYLGGKEIPPRIRPLLPSDGPSTKNCRETAVRRLYQQLTGKLH